MELGQALDQEIGAKYQDQVKLIMLLLEPRTYPEIQERLRDSLPPELQGFQSPIVKAEEDDWQQYVAKYSMENRSMMPSLPGIAIIDKNGISRAIYNDPNYTYISQADWAGKREVVIQIVDDLLER